MRPSIGTSVAIAVAGAAAVGVATGRDNDGEIESGPRYPLVPATGGRRCAAPPPAGSAERHVKGDDFR